MQESFTGALKGVFPFSLFCAVFAAALLLCAPAVFAAVDDAQLLMLPHGGSTDRHLPLEIPGPPLADEPLSSTAPEFSDAQWRALERRGIVRAELKPARPRLLTAPFSGLLREVFVRDGEMVEKDSPVAIFDAEALEDGLRDAKDALSESLARLGGERDDANRAGERAGQELARRADALKEAEARLADARLKAPASGRVVEVFVKSGQHVRRGDSIVELAEAGDMEIVCNVPSAWVSRLEQGHVIWVYVNETAKSYEAEFKRFAGRVNSADKSIRAYALFRGGVPELLPGMSGRADFFPKRAGR